MELQSELTILNQNLFIISSKVLKVEKNCTRNMIFKTSF